MRSLRYLNTVLTLIAVLLTLNLWTAWTAGPGSSLDIATEANAAPAAEPFKDQPGGVGSVAARQKQMIDKLDAINDSVASLEKTLTSGKIRVKVDSMPADKK